MKTHIKLLLLIGVALSGTGCWTCSLIESSIPSPHRYRLVEYDSAFLAENVLTLNGKASKWNFRTEHILCSVSSRKRNMSARYAIDPETGLPDPSPRDVILRSRSVPKGGQRIPIAYVEIPHDALQKSKDPKLCGRITPTNTIPSIIVNALDIPGDSPGRVILVNHRSALYVSGTPSGLSESVVIFTPWRDGQGLPSACLLALPLTIAADIVTSPIQIISYRFAQLGRAIGPGDR